MLNFKSILIEYYYTCCLCVHVGVCVCLVFLSCSTKFSDLILYIILCWRFFTILNLDWIDFSSGQFSKALNRWYTMNFRLTTIIFLFHWKWKWVLCIHVRTRNEPRPYISQFNLFPQKKQQVSFFILQTHELNIHRIVLSWYHLYMTKGYFFSSFAQKLTIWHVHSRKTHTHTHTSKKGLWIYYSICWKPVSVWPLLYAHILCSVCTL